MFINLHRTVEKLGENLPRDGRITFGMLEKAYELTEDGTLEAKNGESAFTHIPDWYAWQRQQVRKELEEGTYRLKKNVKIGMLVDTRAIYMVGSGRLRHDETGFTLTGCDGQLHYTQSPLASYSLYADYYWYEIADVICIGNNDVLYYCFPQNSAMWWQRPAWLQKSFIK